MEETLIKGEEILLETKPHPLSYMSLYIYFIYYLIINGLIVYYWNEIIFFISNTFIGALGSAFVLGSIGLLWWIINILPALVLSIIRISWRWVISYIIFAAILSTLVIYNYLTVQSMFHIMVAISIIGILLVDVYRRAHQYYLTNYRIITYTGFLGRKMRDLFYNRITDLVLEQGFLGKAFNFGTIIPVTAAGLGTGKDIATVIAGVGAGSKTPIGNVGAGLAVAGGKDVTVARGRSSYILFGVPDPEKVRNIILERMKESIEAYKLDRLIELMEEDRKENGESK